MYLSLRRSSAIFGVHSGLWLWDTGIIFGIQLTQTEKFGLRSVGNAIIVTLILPAHYEEFAVDFVHDICLSGPIPREYSPI